MPPAAAPAPVEAADKAATEAEPEIGHPFDPETTACIADLRAISRLPADPDSDGLCTFRAFLLSKKHSMHVPGEPGCYVTAAPYRTQTAIALVHFNKATKREDELLLGFVDYGTLSTELSGMHVMSLQLPLQKQRNVYQETPRFTSIKDVAGFTNINVRQQPWSSMLKPALELQAMYKDFDVYKASDIVSLLKKSTSAARLQQLKLCAEDEIDTMVQDLAKQDKRAAEKSKAKFTAKLQANLEFLQGLPISAYDKATSERILDVRQSEIELDGVATPVKDQLREGKSDRLLTTSRRGMLPLDEAPPAPAPAPEQRQQQESTAEEQVPEPEPEPDEDEFADLDEDEVHVSPAKKLPAKRKRIATVRLDLDDDLPAGRKKPKKVLTCVCAACPINMLTTPRLLLTCM